MMEDDDEYQDAPSPSLVPPRPASPRALASELLASPRYSDEQSHDGKRSKKGSTSAGETGGSEGASSFGKVAPASSLGAAESETVKILEAAAARAMERQQQEVLGQQRRGSVLSRASQLDPQVGASGALQRANEARRTGIDHLSEDEQEFVVDGDGNFKFIPKRKAATIVKVEQAPVKPRRRNSLLAPVRTGVRRLSIRRGSKMTREQATAELHRLQHGTGPTSKWRRSLWNLQGHNAFRGFLLLCIMGSAYSLATEYPADPTKERDYRTVEISLNAVFTMEFLVKYGAFGKAYFYSGWNILDVSVAANGWAILVIEYLSPDRFAESLKLLRLARVLRPLRALSLVPTLREIINALIIAIQDLGSTLLLVCFFTVVFAVFLSTLFSGLTRYRCYDQAEKIFYEDPLLICSRYELVGRQCLRPNSICVDSGVGPYSNLDGLAPYYLTGHEARPIDANPPYFLPMDSFFWAMLVVFQVWAGVGWTTVMYYVTDSLGRAYEALFILMHILGSWFLVNLMVAVLGASFEKETARHKKVEAERERLRALANSHISLRDRIRQTVRGIIRSLGIFGGVRRPASKKAMVRQRPHQSQRAASKASALSSQMKDVKDTRQTRASFSLDGIGAARATHSPPPSPPGIDGGANDRTTSDAAKRAAAGDGEEEKKPPTFLLQVVDSLWFRTIVVFVITSSTILTAVDGPFIRAEYGRASEAQMLDLCNYAFGALFLLEGVLKMLAIGLTEYLSSSVLNIVDFAINVTFVIEQVCMAAGIPVGGFVVAVKAFRMLRIFKLGLTIPAFKKLVAKMFDSISAVSSMLLLILILLFFIACACLHLFHDQYDSMYGGACLTPAVGGNFTTLLSPACASKPRHHFDNIAMAYITIFQIMTTDNWIAVMWDTYLASGTPSLAIFPLVIILGNFIVLNIFLAILLSTFAAAAKAEAALAELKAEKETTLIQEAAATAAKITDQADFLLSAKKRAKARSAASPTGNSRSPSPPRSPGADGLTALSPWSQCSSSSPKKTDLAASAAAAMGSDATLSAIKAFNEIDADGSGTLDLEELCLVLGELGLEDNKKATERTMGMYDLDGSGALDISEFLMLVRDTPPAPPTPAARFIYSYLPEFVKTSAFMKRWVTGASARHAQRLRVRASARGVHARRMRKLCRSQMRARQGKYGSLNAWEVAYFRGAFDKADIDGDGHLVLHEVYKLLMLLDEEPKSNETWDVIDSNASRDDLISREDFLVFISIKRTDDAEIANRGGLAQSNVQLAMRKEANAKRAQVKGQMGKSTWANLLKRRVRDVHTASRRVYLDRLPNIGTFAMEGLGEDRARYLQRVIFSRFFWVLEVTVIVASAVFVTSEIDIYIRFVRLNAGMPSASSDALTPPFVVAAFDSAFMVITFTEILIKLITEGPCQSLSSPWNALDAVCLSLSIARLLFGESARRLLLSFSSLRVFMLVPRFKELKLLFESILRALPNVMVTMISLMVIWLMFAILGVALFGGGGHQCVRLSDTSGYPGCGVDFGSLSHQSSIACRYARAPLPVPEGITPGLTKSSDCGCNWVGGERICNVVNGTDGEHLVWAPAFPSFDSTGEALLSLLQISTLDGWANIMYFGMDVTKVDHQPARENDYLSPLIFYLLFIVFGVLFATNVFVGVIIDEFVRIRRQYDGSVL